MSRIPRVALSLVALLTLLAACSTAPKVKPVPAPSVIERPGQGSLSVADTNSGASIVLERSQALVVRLPIGASVGLEWSLVDMKPGVLEVRSAGFERALRNTTVDEQAGASVWHFAPAAAGTVALDFQLRRPRSTLPAVQTVSYTVTVR